MPNRKWLVIFIIIKIARVVMFPNFLGIAFFKSLHYYFYQNIHIFVNKCVCEGIRTKENFFFPDLI